MPKKSSKKNKKMSWNDKNKKMTWSEMSPGRKAGVIVMGTIQMALAAVAWRDLATRSAEQINGKKGVWAAIIAVNWIGPIAYFIKGRRQDVPEVVTP